MVGKDNFNEFIIFLKTNGFVFKNSELYDGLANTWDFGPLGSLLKNNIKKIWIDEFINKEENNHLIDSAIFSNSKIWKASGHIDNFNDLLIDCKNCKRRYRANHLLEKFTKINYDGKSMEQIQLEFDNYKKVICENCGKNDWTKIRKFDLMFKLNQSLIEGKSDFIYLRPETAQEIFINYKNVLNSTRSKLPLGIGQIGKAFRNEITPENFIFRTKEFEQMELEFFINPSDEIKCLNYYIDKSYQFIKELGLKDDKLKKVTISKEKLAHYSKKTIDINYNFPFGQKELLGIANRGNYDLTKHKEQSNKKLEYINPITNERFMPSIIESSIGVERLMLALLLDAYEKIETKDSSREILNLNKELAPYKIAILPLINKFEIKAKEIFLELKITTKKSIIFDKSGSIGKRYRRQDSIGTPYVVTVDESTLSDDVVTLRERNTGKQKTIKVIDIKNYI